MINIKTNNNLLIKIIASIIIFILIYGFLFKIIPWNLIFSATTISGGDTGSHNYVAWYSRQIFPKIKWWSSDWYAGFPFLYFYPPFLYYLNDLLSFVIPFNISFKIVTLLGTLILPLAIYICLYLLDFQFPIPALGAILSLGYLFLEAFSIYGGNLPSTLAGEFSYSLGFALFFIFIGLMYKDWQKQKPSLITIIILSLMVLIHPFSVIVATLVGGLVFLSAIINKNTKKAFWFLAQIFGLAFAITAFWSVPFIALLSYTSKMSWTKVINLKEIFPSSLIPFQVIAALGLIYALVKKDKRVFWLSEIIIAASIPFFLLNHSSIWNTRFLPFILMATLMISAYSLGNWFRDISIFLTKQKPSKNIRQVGIISLLALLFAGFFINLYLPSTISYIPFWFKWNYEGFEKKSSWPELEQLFSYLKTLPLGRIMWEYRGEYDKFGTPRVLENIPIWANHPTFEGLLIESSLSGYFHFINQAETTQTPTAAIAGMQYPSFNFKNGVKHLQLFGAQYFVAFTSPIKQLADQYFIKLKDVNEFSVYKIPDAELVTLIPQIELILKNKKWLDTSIDWYKSLDFSKFLVFYQNQKELTEIKNYYHPVVENAKGADINIKEIKNDLLVFETKNLFQPHLIKISYFPGWKVIGGKGPYLVSPSFMMVIPTQNQVILQFEYNLWDKIGAIISILGLIIAILITQKPFRFLSNRQQKFLIPPN